MSTVDSIMIVAFERLLLYWLRVFTLDSIFCFGPLSVCRACRVCVVTLDSITLLVFERLVGIADSFFRCGVTLMSAVQALRWYPTFAFSLRCHSDFCFLWWVYIRTNNSYFRRRVIMISAIRAFRWYSQLWFSLWCQSEFWYLSFSLNIKFRIVAMVS